MGLMKLNQILKKYKDKHKRHKASWDDAQKRIRQKPASYSQESYAYQLEGNKILDEMMNELEGREVFPKKQKTKDEKAKAKA